MKEVSAPALPLMWILVEVTENPDPQTSRFSNEPEDWNIQRTVGARGVSFWVPISNEAMRLPDSLQRYFE